MNLPVLAITRFAQQSRVEWDMPFPCPGCGKGHPPPRVGLGTGFSERWYVLEGWSVSRQMWIYREDARPFETVAHEAWRSDWCEAEYLDYADEKDFRRGRGDG